MTNFIALALVLAPHIATNRGYDYSSRYLTMRDGVRIAVDLYLPKRLAADTRLPTIMLQTRYFRSHRVSKPFDWFWGGILEPTIARYVEHGYAYVVVDARGSGASFGTRTQEWSPDEVRDGAEVVDWIVAQAWSNGRVGSTGGSYEGAATDFLLSNRHPAVRATVPVGGMFDVYTEIAYPGGVKLAPFVDFWGHMTAAQDSNNLNSILHGFPKLVYRGVRPVQGDSGELLLAQASAEHRRNYNMPAVAGAWEFRTKGDPSELMSAYTKRAEIAESGAAIYSVSGWYDGALVNSAIKRFLTIRTPGSRLTLGPWSHQGENLSPFSVKPNDYDGTADRMRFFDHALKGEANGLENEPPVRYYTVGEERWKTAPTWPPPGTTTRKLYLSANGALSSTALEIPDASDRYQVDLTAGSGQETRWNNLTMLDLAHRIVRDRRERDRKLLVYDGAPLDADVEVTGHPMATIYLESSEPDGAIFVYLEDVEPSGGVHYVTEGVLRLIHRRTNPAAAPYVFPAPYRTFSKDDSEPLVPGSVAEVAVDLYPISYLFRAGHSIRLALAGADVDHFAQPAKGQPVWTVHRDATHASRIDLPVMPH